MSLSAKMSGVVSSAPISSRSLLKVRARPLKTPRVAVPATPATPRPNAVASAEICGRRPQRRRAGRCGCRAAAAADSVCARGSETALGLCSLIVMVSPPVVVRSLGKEPVGAPDLRWRRDEHRRQIFAVIEEIRNVRVTLTDDITICS